MLGIHWRHRIVDPVAGYLSQRLWQAELGADDYYPRYAAVEAAGERAPALAALLRRVDAEQPLLSTWTGRIRDDGHYEHQQLAGDYGEAFTVHEGTKIPDEKLTAQVKIIEELDRLLQAAATREERERLGYLAGQIRFLDPYAHAWRAGIALHALIAEHYPRLKQNEPDAAIAAVREQGLPLWLELIGHVREAVLAFQRTVATRNDLGMLASIHNKFVRIATFRLRESLLEFLDELPPDAEAAAAAALAPDTALEGALIVPTRPTRLRPGETVRITAIAPGTREPTALYLVWRHIGADSPERLPLRHAGRRTYTIDFAMPHGADLGIEYYVEATFAGAPAPLVVLAPPSAPDRPYVITV
jgi:hypothetical protein